VDGLMDFVADGVGGSEGGGSGLKSSKSLKVISF